MKKIRKAYDLNPSCPGLTCSKYDYEYGYKFEEGARVFGIIGEKDIYAEIQRDKDNTDFNILKKYLFNNYTGGDIPGIYGDRSIEVKDLIEGADFLQSMQDKFNALPDIVKERYPTLMEFVYGFNEKDFDLFKKNDEVVDDASSDSERGK